MYYLDTFNLKSGGNSNEGYFTFLSDTDLNLYSIYTI